MKTFFWVLLLCSVEALGNVLPENWKRVGEAELSILWFDVYHAELLSPDGRYSGDSYSGDSYSDVNYSKVINPLILKLNYRRNISQQDLLEETKKQIEKFAHKDQTDQWLIRLSQFWPDIRKGDQLAFWIDENSTGHFFFNGSWIGALQDPTFSYAFIQIWLSDNSSYPDLAKQLRGSVKQ